MMENMRKLLAKMLVGVLMLLAMGFATGSARADDNTPKSFDGRLDDYGKPVTLDSGGTALTYFIWVGLGVAAVIVTFKDAKRSHLD
jgi:hypothetical protein